MARVAQAIGMAVAVVGFGVAAVSAQAPEGEAGHGDGARGRQHLQCAIGCDKAGVRMSLLDEKANVLYTLMAD
ncbi:MAG: hypothetical protein ACREKS_05075 [Candidatus Rokuibacteriota bacterium]